MRAKWKEEHHRLAPSKRTRLAAGLHCYSSLGIFLALLIIVEASLNAELNWGQAAVKLYKFGEDPLAQEDSFAGLPTNLKSKWSKKVKSGIASKVKGLQDLEVTVGVHVKLVGFDGDGHMGLSVRDADFQRHLDSLRTDTDVQVIHGEAHQLAIKSRVQFFVDKSPHQLVQDIYHSVENGLASALPWNGSLTSISHRFVDRILEAEHREDNASYTLYLLNVPPASRPFAYSYGSSKDCPGNFFASRERYMWLDLSAGPVSYGPAAAGEGLVTHASFIRASGYAREQLQGAYMAHLVTLVAGAVRHLVAPPLQHFPVHFAKTTVIQLVHLQESGVDSPDDVIDLRAIETALLAKHGEEGLLFPQQKLIFKTARLQLAKCAFCTASYARALRSWTGKELGEVPGVTGGPRVERYLDSEELHHLLSQFWPEMKTAAGIEDAESLEHEPGATWRMIPVFLLDLDTEERILLDRTDQAVSYPDMVVAVRSLAPRQPGGFVCDGIGMEMDAQDTTRPVMAALLQTAWGVAPPQVTWSPVHRRVEEDYRWAVGTTPWGALSGHLGLSFSPIDAARRHVVLTLINETVTDTLHLLEAIKAYQGEEVALHSKHAQVAFTQRWNVLLHKLTKACFYLKQLQLPVAQYYALSAQHDLRALFDVAKTSASDLHTQLECYKDGPVQWLWYLSVLLSGAALGFLILRRDQLFRFESKAKRF